MEDETNTMQINLSDLTPEARVRVSRFMGWPDDVYDAMGDDIIANIERPPNWDEQPPEPEDEDDESS